MFTRQELLIHGLKVYDYQLSLWVKKGYLIRLKNGVYAFARDADQLVGEEIAYLLYQPSYLSMESVLSGYGFIPEMVYAQTSVTSKINRVFDNDFGRFIYRHIKKELFWGYRTVSAKSGQYLMAEPEKAVLDYLYLNLSKIRSQKDFEGIRFNGGQLRSRLEPEKFLRYLAAFDVARLEKWATQCLQ
ncbi:MAG: type IV toxin-antitoxin system AbiEi family antitoxin domain-containing protein [Halobacteriales archaeon]|nr:type IV toxin-antitoxin system AbiEi family antitoxin domain-containing protein [Halobacteriales archaeon]